MKIICFLTGCAVGAIAGSFLTAAYRPEPSKTVDHPRSLERLDANSPLESARSVNSTATDQSLAAKPAEKIVKVPESLMTLVSPSFIAANGVELNALSFLGYGLNEEETIRLTNGINSRVDQITALEAANSKLVSLDNGDQFYRIQPFKEQGLQIKSEVENQIKGAFSRFSDDRGELFRRQLFKTPLFDDFGQNTREISFDEAFSPDGTPGQVMTTVYYDGDTELRRVSSPFNLYLMQTRFQKLVDKHKEQN